MIEREEYKHYTTDDGDSHYFAASAAGWGADVKLTKAIAKAKDGLRLEEILIYFVPVGVKSSYTIKNYAPVVDGVIFIGRVTA